MQRRCAMLLAAALFSIIQGSVCFAFAPLSHAGAMKGGAWIGPMSSRRPLIRAASRGQEEEGSDRLRVRLNLRRADRVPEDSEGGDESQAAEPVADTPPDVGDWKVSKKKAPGIVDAASDVMEWMLRVQIERDENDEEMKAIAAEFKFDEEEEDLNTKLTSSGGAAGRSKEGESESWFRNQKIMDKDQEMIDTAGELNITFSEYLATYMNEDRMPTSEVVSASNRRIPEGALQFVTTPHSYPINTLVPRVPFSTCWYGVFFEIEALDRDIEIIGIYSQTGMYWRDVRDLVNISIYTHEGEAAGKELCAEEWEEVGRGEDVRMIKVNFTRNSNPVYSKLPLAKPLVVKAGTVRGMLVHTSDFRGLAIRARDQGSWTAGEISDEDDYIHLRAGLLPCQEDDTDDKVFQSVFSPRDGAAFVGIIDYRLF